MLSNDSLELVKDIYAKLTSGHFESFKELRADGKNQYFRDGAILCKALFIENQRGSIELQSISHELKTANQGFYAPCYIISSTGTLYNLKQKQGFGPVISKVKDSLKADFCQAANLDEKLIELLTNTKPKPKLEFIKVSEGYDLEGLPSSCQSGKGYRFKALDNMAQMALLRIGSRIAARCIVWNKGVIYDETKSEYSSSRYADKLYYGDSDDRNAFVKALKDEEVKLLWGKQNDALQVDTGDCSIKIKDTSYISWLDTFSLMKNDKLYSYDWSNGGYYNDALNKVAREYGFTRAFLSVDEEGGEDLHPDEVYSEYLGEYLDSDEAVYSDSLEDNIPRDEAIYSNYLNDYLLERDAIFSSIEDDYITQNEIDSDTRIAIDIDSGAWVLTSNNDYVPYKDQEFEKIALENAVYVEANDEYLRLDEALYIDEIDEYVPSDWAAKDLKDRLADCMSDWTDELLDELVEKYGF
ncbi:hypothetical protein [Campylobacter concisus]|uniref:hypothetical protein n=1 Tax=Campylobacter concisus TaxID=199 RepID=UPI000CD9E6DB|nr:hypothetical protein [Campylobacter concisus]